MKFSDTLMLSPNLVFGGSSESPKYWFWHLQQHFLKVWSFSEFRWRSGSVWR